jgi:hypothetical protein
MRRKRGVDKAHSTNRQIAAVKSASGRPLQIVGIIFTGFGV